MKILVFTEGTIIMHKDKKSIHDYSSYIPIGNAVDKLNNWRNQGAIIIYLTSRIKNKEVNDVKVVLNKYNFPDGQLLFRKEKEEYTDMHPLVKCFLKFFHAQKEKYKDIAEKVMPDILIEDDCESIGGADNMTITYIKPEIKKNIKVVCVKEFKGIDHLPDNIFELVK